LEEALRRKVFVVVLLLTLAFLGLYWLGNHYAFKDLSGVQAPAGIDARTFAGSFIFGLAMFATLFLGVVLAIFLTLGTVRGDGERDRDLHGLRRGTRRWVARLDRPRAQLPHARASREDRRLRGPGRGALPGCARSDHGGLARADAVHPRARPLRRRVRRRDDR